MGKDNQFKLDKRYLIIAVMLLIGMYVIIPQLGDFKSSLHLLTNPDIAWTLAALVFTTFTYFSAAGTYYFLSYKNIPYILTVFVQVAAMFINRLLPGGVGALGANFLYLKKQKHSTTQAATVIAINNFLGFIGHNILFWLLILFTGYSTINGNESDTNKTGTILLVIVGISAVLILFGFIYGKKRIISTIKDIKNQILNYRKRPKKLIYALLSTMTLTIFNVFCLYACAQALGVELNLAVIFLIFTFGLTAGTLTPTPGGLGGFEAGLVAGFLAYDINSSVAFAIALLYRLISYWLPLILGSVAFVIASRKKLFG